MGRVIEVYVRNVKIEVPCGYAETIKGHPCTGGETFRTESMLGEADKEALEIAQKVAETSDSKVKVYDVDSLAGKLRARLRGVRSTPTVVVGSGRIDRAFAEEELMSLLRQPRQH